MTLNSQIKLAFLSVLLLAGAIIYFMRPVFGSIEAASNQLIAERNNLFSLESKIRDLEKFQTEYEKISPDLIRTDSLFVDVELPVDFIRFLEETSQSSSISLKMSPSPPIAVSGDPWMSSNFQLTLAGPYSSVLRFIDKLENGRYLIGFSSLSFSKLTDMELKSKEFGKFSSGDIKGSISIKVFAK